MVYKTYLPNDTAIHPIEAIQLTQIIINSFPRTGADIIQFGDGIQLLTGRRIGQTHETVEGKLGDYLVVFNDEKRTKTILQKILFEQLYKEAEEGVTFESLKDKLEQTLKEEKENEQRLYPGVPSGATPTGATSSTAVASSSDRTVGSINPQELRAAPGGSSVDAPQVADSHKSSKPRNA